MKKTQNYYSTLLHRQMEKAKEMKKAGKCPGYFLQHPGLTCACTLSPHQKPLLTPHPLPEAAQPPGLTVAARRCQRWHSDSVSKETWYV